MLSPIFLCVAMYRGELEYTEAALISRLGLPLLLSKADLTEREMLSILSEDIDSSACPDLV